MADYSSKSIHETLTDFEVTEHGLSTSEAAERLRQYGLNVVRVRGEPFWRKILEPFLNVFMLVLAIAATVSVLHHEIIDAIIVTAIMLANALIYYVQRFSTERVLRSLQRRTKDIVTVLRENKAISIDATLLVPGDIIVLSEGEKIPADARLIQVDSLRVDESQLTGESLPIDKDVETLHTGAEIYERANMVYQGSFVVGGTAQAVVVSTGNGTEFGKLAVLSVAAQEPSPVQVKIDKLISIIIRVVAGVAVVAFVLGVYRGMDYAESLRYVLALSVSAVPESLPVAISVVLVLGMRRMAAKKALVRTMRAIETVGIVTTIASDKTGTLTKNKLTVQHVWSPDDNDKHVASAIAHATNIALTAKAHDPLDTALADYVAHAHARSITPNITYPFEQTVAMSGNVVKHDGDLMLWVKGAPEHILARSVLTKSERSAAEHQLHSFAANGFRVIALASMHLKQAPKTLADIPTSQKLDFIGFVAVADVLRAEAKHAIRTASAAGIRVRMITGDHFETAFHIAQQLGMAEHRNQVFDCRQLSSMSDAELERVIEDITVFSRVLPEYKHRILTILKKHHITAMTGDGVNDVPALTNAHVGLAMGSGASIAKDAGDIILLDDNFKSIVAAIHEGRTIYANIKRMVAYLLSTNAGEVLVALTALIVGVPVPLVAVQILWVNLVTDTSMVIPLGLEPGEKHNMNRPPQKPNAPLFSGSMILRIVLVAVTMASLTLLVYITYISRSTTAYAQTIAFHALVVMQWANAFNYRSDYESVFSRIRRFAPSFYIGLAVAVGLQVVALCTQFRSFLHLESLQIDDVLVVTILSFVLPIFVVEVHKWIGRRYFGKGHRAKVILETKTS